MAAMSFRNLVLACALLVAPALVHAQTPTISVCGSVCTGIDPAKLKDRKLLMSYETEFDYDVAGHYACNAEFESNPFPDGHWAQAAVSSDAAAWQQLLARTYYYHVCKISTGDHAHAATMSGIESARDGFRRRLMQNADAPNKKVTASSTKLKVIATAAVTEVNTNVGKEIDNVKKSDLSKSAKTKLCKSCLKSVSSTASTFDAKYGEGAAEIAKIPDEAAQDAATDVFTTGMDKVSEFIGKALNFLADGLLKALKFAVQNALKLIGSVLNEAGDLVKGAANSAVSSITSLFG